MYSRSWTTSENLYNRQTNLFFHASCARIVSAKAPDQQFTQRQLTSTTTSPSAQRNHHQHNNITSAMKSQRNHQHNKITSTTTFTSATKSPAQRTHQRTSLAQQNQQHKEITSTTKSPAQRHHQRNESTSTTKSPANSTIATKSPARTK